MYTDLKRYISTQKCELEAGTYGWYVKQFCEYSNNDTYVNDLMKALKLAFANEYNMDDINLFEDLIDDYHVQDVLDVANSIMLKIILSCFVDDFILYTDNGGYFAQFMEYSRAGQIASGKEPNILAEWLETNFYGFADMLTEDGTLVTAEELKENKADIEELYEEAYMSSAILVVDEKSESLNKCEILLDMLGFMEVVPGLYYSGVTYYDGSMGDSFYTLNSDEIMHLMDLLSTNKKNRSVSDDIFYALNEDSENFCINRLISNLKICRSSREVMF